MYSNKYYHLGEEVLYQVFITLRYYNNTFLSTCQ
nr:MAG TPA: hypothetical protein [Caudoviricetes sp.]